MTLACSAQFARPVLPLSHSSGYSGGLSLCDQPFGWLTVRLAPEALIGGELGWQFPCFDLSAEGLWVAPGH